MFSFLRHYSNDKGTLKYYVVMLPFDVPAFRSSKTEPLLAEPVEIATNVCEWPTAKDLLATRIWLSLTNFFGYMVSDNVVIPSIRNLRVTFQIYVP